MRTRERLTDFTHFFWGAFTAIEFPGFLTVPLGTGRVRAWALIRLVLSIVALIVVWRTNPSEPED